MSIRPDWFMAVSAAQQRLAGSTLDGDCDLFARGLERFQDDLPAPRSHIERRVLHDCVIATLTEAGHQCHRAFHGRHPEVSCGGSPVAEMGPVWRDANWSEVISRWTHEYRHAFQVRHAWPAHVQVAEYLDLHFREPLDVRELARRFACGRTPLLRQFKAAFGMTIGRYQTRLKIRQAIIDLRGCGAKIDDVARILGYRSPKSLYANLKNQTGLRPSDVRNLAESAVRRLLDVTLAMPPRVVTSRRALLEA